VSYSLFSPQGFLKEYQRHILSSKLQHEFFSCKGFLILVYNEAIIKCYNFLLLFPSGFKEFYFSAYTHVFFLVFILQEFLEEQYDSLISTSDSIKGECYGYFTGVISSPRILLREIYANYDVPHDRLRDITHDYARTRGDRFHLRDITHDSSWARVYLGREFPLPPTV
jgi:hypothetical protein